MSRPVHHPDRLPVGLCVFGLTYLCGLTWANTDRRCPNPLTAEQIIDLAADSGLSWVELPTSLLGGTDAVRLNTVRHYAEARCVRFVVAGGVVNADALRRDLRIAQELGAPTVRCILSRVLCGDRRGFPGGWKNHLEACTRELEAVLPEAERAGVAIAVENHQDADSEDLLRLCRRFESRYLGVTLDSGNPLAVMEDPVEFAARLAPYLRHAHLKDYRVYPAPNGFRLVRCALGDGVIDFPALFRLLDAQEWPITRNLEGAALEARQIPMLERSWWDEYPERDARTLLPALNVVWKHRRPAEEEWRTPFERNADGEHLARYEREQHAASVAAVRRLLIQ